MQENPKSKMWEIGSFDKINGNLAFDYKDADESAKSVVDGYIEK